MPRFRVYTVGPEVGMAKVGRFEDLEAWKKARELTRSVYAITSAGRFERDFGLRDQLRRASVSIMSNIAEGFERGGDREFRQFLSHAKGSAAEVRAQMYVAIDAGLVSQTQFEQVHGLADETGRLIGGLMRYLTTSEYKGNKFR